MIRLWLNPIILTLLILLAAASTFGLSPQWVAFAVGLAAAALIANATLALAKAMTQRSIFTNAMWTIAFMGMLGLQLSGSLNQKPINFDDELWSYYLPEDNQQEALALLRQVAFGQMEQLPPSYDAQSQEARVTRFVAVEYGNKSFLKHMLQSGLSPESKLDGYSLLCSAIIAGQVPIVELLLDSGAQVNVLGDDDLSPLMHAAIMGNMDCVELLQEKGAKSAMKNRNGLDARSYAQNGRMLQLFES
ncbi:MAG: ankyrin repeat domain-containing protein [Akkermansia sp.]